MKSLEERFWSKVNKTDTCWLWQGGISDKGYGGFWDGKNWIKAHRFSFELHFGNIPENFHILHKCDVRHCIRPDHLFLGTNKDNVNDKVMKDRQAKGSKNGNSILDENQVIEIKLKLKNKYYGYLKDLMIEYNISERCIFDIKNGRTWKHV